MGRADAAIGKTNSDTANETAVSVTRRKLFLFIFFFLWVIVYIKQLKYGKMLAIFINLVYAMAIGIKYVTDREFVICPKHQ